MSCCKTIKEPAEKSHIDACVLIGYNLDGMQLCKLLYRTNLVAKLTTKSTVLIHIIQYMLASCTNEQVHSKLGRHKSCLGAIAASGRMGVYCPTTTSLIWKRQTSLLEPSFYDYTSEHL